ncbi:MAG: GNAT family N-acetyltransferase [Geodermatophilaceae bacterium]|nr:GNAT family N-acetyltransferase [Geodermatophilaceae bacterium]
MNITLRPAVPSDRDALLALVPRLRSFGDPPLRSSDALDETERETLTRALDTPEADALVIVAELARGELGGVAYAQTVTDYFTRERHGHLGIIAVAAEGEGRGIGRALLVAVEQWATDLGYRFISLNVFAANARARAVYERAGYALDTLRYYKELDP